MIWGNGTYMWFLGAPPNTTSLTPYYTDEPNFIEDFGVGPWNVMTIALVAVAMFSTILIGSARTFTKIRIMKEWFLEDYLFIVASITTLGLFSVSLHPAIRGAREITNVPVAGLEEWLKWLNINASVWAPAMFLARWSNIMQLQRVFVVTRKSRAWWLCCVVMGVCVVGYTILLFLAIFQCSALEQLWDPEHYFAHASCPKIKYVSPASGVLNAVLNLLTFMIPVSFIWKLQIRRRTKITAMVIFGVDFLSLCCAVGRTITILYVWRGISFTHDYVGEIYWSHAEIFLVLLASCTPTFPIFYMWIRGRDTVYNERMPLRRKRTNMSRFYHIAPAHLANVGAPPPAHPPTVADPQEPNIPLNQASEKTTVGPRSQKEIEKAMAEATEDNERRGRLGFRLIAREEWDCAGATESALAAIGVQIV